MTLSYVAPAPELAVELGEVRADATSLANVFTQLNAPLPEDFPKDAVIELANALRDLPDGTGRGCLRPLNEAQSQLATIRSQHIRHDDHLGSAWEHERPPLFRGEPVDQQLRNLMSSVSTALQTANRLAADEPEPDEPEAGVEPPNDSSTANLIKKSKDTQNELEIEREQLNSLNIDSVSSDTLSRRLTDTIVLNRLGRGELRLPRIVSARLRRIGAALSDYPELIRKAAEAISAAANLADYAHTKWHKLEDRIFHAGTATVREVADDMSNYARKLERKKRDMDATEIPSDFDLEQAAKLIHSGISPPINWRHHIKHLPLGNRRLKSLAPLEGLTNLRGFDRASVRVKDISALSSLTSLEHLDLSDTQVNDLTAISDLTSLSILNVSNTKISDLRAISKLSNLTGLNFKNTSVSDLQPLSDLPKIMSIDLGKTKISDLQPLAKLSTLTSLDLSETAASNLSPLSALLNLESLNADETQVSDIEFLRTLSKMKHLYLNNTNILDLTPLTNFTSLRSLSLDHTPVSDLSPISKCVNMDFLSCEYTNVLDTAPLAGLRSLDALYLGHTKIFDLKPLTKLSTLTWLYIRNTPVSDIGPLTNLTNLRFLNLSETRISNINSIAELRALRSLYISGTQVSDLQPLALLRELDWVDAAETGVKKIPNSLKRKGLYISGVK